ncbi:MAG TPA: glycosyltransferase family 4 protein [Burkholderiales bacterium]|nr:glycosyltransferase family 4 protein [Burkholderiales bacterium]
MKILIVSQYFWPETFRINDLVLGMKDRGHDVAVLTGMPNYPSGRFFPGYGFFSRSKELFQDVPVYRVPLIPRGKGQGWRLALNYFSFFFFASVFGPFLCRGRFELIFVYEPSPITVCLPAIVLKWLKRAPLILWVQDLWPESLSATGAVQSRFILNWVTRLVRFIYRHCALILVQSEGFISRVLKMEVEPRRVRYFPNWAETLYQPLLPGQDAPERTQMPNGFRVMFAGNIGAAQSFETILAAAEKLKHHQDIHWVILGDGHKKDWVAQQINVLRLEDKVHLLGHRPVETMPRYFALADAMLVTLRRDPVFALTVPSKVQSYLACAKPIISAADGETARVVENSGAGFSCPAEDATRLADAVLKLYRMSPRERQEMGEKGRTYFEMNFQRERLLDRLEQWMRELAGTKQCVS